MKMNKEIINENVGLKYHIGTMLTNEHGLMWEVVGYYKDNLFYRNYHYRLKQHPPKINTQLSMDWFVFGQDFIDNFWPATDIGKLLYGNE